MVFPIYEYNRDGSNFGRKYAFTRARSNRVSTRAPSPSAGASFIRVERSARVFNDFRLIFDFFCTRIRMNTFLRFATATAYTTAVCADCRMARTHRMNFPASSPFIRGLLQAQATVLRRRCQVAFNEVRVSQFRRPTIRVSSFYYFRHRRFFLQCNVFNRFLFRFVVYCRDLRSLAYIIVRNGRRQDVRTNGLIRRVFRQTTRSKAINSQLVTRFRLLTLAICLMCHLARQTFFVTDMVGLINVQVPSSGIFCFVIATNRLFSRIAIRTVPMRIEVSTLVTGGTRVFKVRLGIVRCVFISMVEEFITWNRFTRYTTEVNGVRIRTILIAIRYRSNRFIKVLDRASTQSVSINICQRLRLANRFQFSIRHVC